MFRNALLAACLLPGMCSLFAQGFIRGVVTDKTNSETIPGVIIAIGHKAALTSTEGAFILSAPAGPQTVVASMAGYKTFRQNVTLTDSDTLVLEIALETSNLVLDEVVVSAGKYEQKLSDVTVSMEVIKPDLLQNKAVAQLDQIMNQVPSVYITDSQVSIRGGSGYSYGAGSRVLMLVDEMPMISADAADIKWNYIAIENMEQVEIIKGASSALFGSSALNGVVNLRTRYAREKPETQIITYSGVYDTPKKRAWAWWKSSNRANPGYQGTTFAHAQKFGALDLVLSGQLYNDDSHRKDAEEQRGRASLNLRYNFKQVRGLSAGVNGTIMKTTGGLFFIWKSDSLALEPRDSTIQNYDNLRYNLDPYLVYNNEKAGRFSLRTRMFVTDNHNDKNQNSNATLYYREFQWQKRFSRLNLSSGLVQMRQVVNGDSLYGVHYGQNIAWYMQADRKFFGRLTASAGARAEYFKVDTSQTRGGFFLLDDAKQANLPVQPVFRAGLNYQLFEYTFLRTSFGQGYRFPSVAEKYIATTIGGSGLNIFPNAQLQPERGWSAEVGIKQGFKVGKFQGFADVAAFTTHYFNMMDFVFIYDTIGKSEQIWNANNPLMALFGYAGFQSQNVGRAVISGFDVSVNGTGKIGPVEVTLLTGYTLTNPINPDFDPKKDTMGTLRTNVLRYRNRYLFKNDIQLGWKGLALGWSIRYSSFMENIDKRFEEPLIYERMNPNTSLYYDPNFYILPGLKKYRADNNNGNWVNDLRVSYQFNAHFRLAFLVNNMMNAEFMSRPGYMEPPRTFVAQATFRF
jgi:outer membrane receptor protein involved in Fe transport